MWFIKNLVFHIWVTFREIPADEWAIGEKALAPIRNSIWLGWFLTGTSRANKSGISYTGCFD